MRIKSHYAVKDYYDYLQQYENDSANTVLFNRLNLLNEGFNKYFVLDKTEWKDWKSIGRLTIKNYKSNQIDLNVSTLICLAVCGNYYYFNLDLLPIKELSSKRFHFPSNEDVYEELLILHKRYNSPILMFYVNNYNGYRCNTNGFYLCNKVPLLQDFKFAKIIKPEQMYQKIEWFLNNYVRETPDVKPPVIISNEDLIVSKGFDKKISFRHRT